MLVSEIIRRVRDIAGDINVLQFTDVTLMDWINDGIREVVISNSLLQKTAQTTVASGSAELILPVDIFKLHSVLVDGSRVPVKTMQEHEAYNNGVPQFNQESGEPAYCYIWAKTITFVPKSDITRPVRINYIYEPPNVTAPADTPAIPQEYHLRLVTYCLAQVALQDEDYPKYQNLLAQFGSGVLDLKHQGESEEDLYPFISTAVRDMGNSYSEAWWD